MVVFVLAHPLVHNAIAAVNEDHENGSSRPYILIMLFDGLGFSDLSVSSATVK